MAYNESNFSAADSPTPSKKKMKRKRKPHQDEPARPLKSAAREVGEEDRKTAGVQWRNLDLSLQIESKELSALKKVELVHSYLNSVENVDQAGDVSLSRLIVRISSWIQSLLIKAKDKMVLSEYSELCLDCRCWEILRYCLQESSKMGFSLSLSGDFLRVISFAVRNAVNVQKDCLESEGYKLYRPVYDCIRCMFSLHNGALMGNMDSWMAVVGSVLELVTNLFAENLGSSESGNFFIDLSCCILEPFSKFLMVHRWRKNGFRDFVDGLLEPLLHLLGLLHHHQSKSNTAQNLTNLIEEIISCGLFHSSHMDEFLNLQGLGKYSSSSGEEVREWKIEIRSYHRHLFEKLLDFVSQKKEWALGGSGELFRLFVKQVKNQKRELLKVESLEPSLQSGVSLENSNNLNSSLRKSAFEFLVQIMEPLLLEIKLYIQSDVGMEISPLSAQSILRSINKMLSSIICEKVYVRTEDISEGACINFLKAIYGLIISCSAKVIGLFLSSCDSNGMEQMNNFALIAEELVVAVGHLLEIDHKVIGEGLDDLWLMILAFIAAAQYFNKKSEVSPLILRTVVLSCQLVNLFKELREASHAVFALCRALRYLSSSESKEDTLFSEIMSVSLLHDEVISKSAELLMRSQKFRVTIHEALKSMPEGQASDCFCTLIIDVSESLDWQKAGFSTIVETEPRKGNSHRFSVHTELLGKIFSEIYSLVLDSIPLTAGNSSNFGDDLNRLITVMQPIMSSFVASTQYRTRGIVIPSMGLTLKGNMLDACHWILMFFFRLYVSCRSLFRQAISLMPPRSSLKMYSVVGDCFTKYSGMDWIKSDDFRKEGYFSWISQSASPLPALIESIRQNLDQTSSADYSSLVYMLHLMAVQRIVDLNRQINFVQYLLQENSSLSAGKRIDDVVALVDKKDKKWKKILSDLEEEASSLTVHIMKSLSLVDLEELGISRSGEDTSKGFSFQPLIYSWDMGVCSLDKKALPIAVWWSICQNVGVWCSHATDKELELFLSILIRSVLRYGCPSPETLDSSDVKRVTVQQISFDLLQDASFYEITFVRRYLAPNIFSALLKFNSFPEWVEVLSTLEFSNIDEEKGTVSFSNNDIIEEFFRGGGLFPLTTFQFTVCQNLLNLLIHMPKRSLTTESFLLCTRFLLNLERVIVRSFMDTPVSSQSHGQCELFRLLVCCRRALKCLIIAFSEEKNKASESFGIPLFGESLSRVLWLPKSAAMVVERVNNCSNNGDFQTNSMIFTLMDHTAGVFMTLTKYWYNCSVQLHNSGLDCKGSASISTSIEGLNACRIINTMAELLSDLLNDTVKGESTKNSLRVINLNKMSALLSCSQGFLWGLASALNNIDAGNCILSVEVSGEQGSISQINQFIETTSDFMDYILKKFLIDDGHMVESICDAQGFKVESSIHSCYDGNKSEHLDSETGQLIPTLPEFDSASEGGIFKNLLQGFFGSQNLDYLFSLRELFIAYSAILRLRIRRKCSPLSSSLMKFLLGNLQKILLRFANMDQVPKGFWLVLDGALQFMEELGYQYASSYLTMTSNDFVKLVRLHFKAIGKCISLQQKTSKLASHKMESSTKTLTSQLEGFRFSSSHAVYSVEELKTRLRMSFKILIKNSSECHLESAMQALERALVGLQEGCTMIYELSIGKDDGGTIPPTTAAGIDCLNLMLDCVEGRRSVKEKLQSLSASLFNIVIHLQGPIFYRNLIHNEEDINPDPGPVIVMCIEVLTRVSRKDTLFQIGVGNQSKSKQKIDVGQFLRLPAALFHDFCHLKVQNPSYALNNVISPATNASAENLVDRQFSVDLYAACCRLLCTAVKHRHSESVKKIGLLQYSVDGLLNCLEMAGSDSADRNGYFTWTLEEGIECASYLQRVYEEIGHQRLFKEHCFKFLSSYISIFSGCGPLRKGLKREIDEAMRPGVYALIDACSEQNLQCLHTEFGEGPCRRILASLRHDHKLNFQYHGKV